MNGAKSMIEIKRAEGERSTKGGILPWKFRLTWPSGCM